MILFSSMLSNNNCCNQIIKIFLKYCKSNQIIKNFEILQIKHQIKLSFFLLKYCSMTFVKLEQEVLISFLTSLLKSFFICNTHSFPFNFCLYRKIRKKTVNKSIHDCVEEIFRCIIFYKTFPIFLFI